MPFAFLEFYLYFILAASGLTGLGFGVLRLLKQVPEKRYAALFASALTGITVFVCAVSVFATRGYTVNLGLLLLGGLAAWVSFKARPGILPEPKQPLPGSSYSGTAAVLGAVSLLLLGFAFWLNNGFNGFGAVRLDESFYAKLSHTIWVTGVESYNLEVLYPEANSISPYHYFELWLTAGLSALFSINTYFGLVLLTATLVVFTFYLGICAVFERFGKNSLLYKAAAVLLLFTAGIYFPFFENMRVIGRAGFLQSSLFHNPKFFTAYLFLMAAALAYLYRNYRFCLLFLLALPVVSILTAPGILLALPMLAGYLYFIRKEKKNAIAILMGSFSVLFFIVGFYLTRKSEAGIHAALLSEHLNFSVLSHMRQSFKVIAEGVLHIGGLYILFFGLALFLVPFKKVKAVFREEPALLFAVLVFGGSLLVWALLKNMTDSFQLFLGISVPLLNVLLIVFLARNLSVPRYKLLTGFFLLVVSFFTVPLTIQAVKVRPDASFTYQQQVLQATAHLNPVGAFIRAKADYWIIFTMNTNTYPLGVHLVLNSPRHHTVGLSVFDIPLDPKKENYETIQKLVAQTSFYQFVKRQKEKNVFKSVEQSQLDFVKAFMIEYILVSKTAQLPELLAAEVKTVIVDPVSGEKCYLLKAAPSAEADGNE